MKVIKFFSKSCPPCKKLSPITKEIAAEYPEVEWLGVDIEKERELAQQFGVRSVPTMVFVKNNEEVDRLVGLVPKKEIEERVFLLME